MEVSTEMERLVYNELLEWKNKKDRKPLIINGARQVGKTWLLKEFGANEYLQGGRAKEFENAIQWLVDAGLVYKVLRLSKVEKPLKFYEDLDAFKLFIVDLGLLGAIAEVDAKDVLVNNTAFIEYKGAFTEQYVLQELAALGKKAYYHTR